MGASVKLIRENSLRVEATGYAFDIRLNWYRSLPLSSVDILSLKMDGEQVPSDQIYFQVNGHTYPIQELVERFEELWFVQDSAGLFVHQPGKVQPGTAHTLEAEVSLRFPYMNIGPGKFLTNVTKFASTQIAR